MQQPIESITARAFARVNADDITENDDATDKKGLFLTVRTTRPEPEFGTMG